MPHGQRRSQAQAIYISCQATDFDLFELQTAANFRLYATVFSYLLLPQPRVEFSVHSQYATRTIRRNSSKRKKVDITASNLVRTSFGPDHLIYSGFEVYVFEVILSFELYE